MAWAGSIEVMPELGGGPREKGLRRGALGFLSGIVIGVASTAPGYSLAAALGLVAAEVGFQAPAILLLAAPDWLAGIHPRFRTPGAATVWMGVVSIAWYAGLTLVSQNILYDALLALGLMIAFYYGLTGFACAIYFRRELARSARNLLLIGIAPVMGGLIFLWALIRSVIDLADPALSAAGGDWFGLGRPLVIGVGFAALGIVLMAVQRLIDPHFFRRRPEVAARDSSLSC